MKHYLIEREDLSLVDVLSSIGQRHRTKDIGVEEPTIEEVIRTFYASRSGKAA
ncbi:hypothetical protein D3C84_1239420 [compost metagenome]